MLGASNRQMATTLVNGLDALSHDLIMPYLLDGVCKYKQEKEAVLEKFQSPKKMATHKKKFLNIKFKPNKTLVEIVDCFFHKAQILVGARSMTDFNSKFAMEHAIKIK